MAINQMETASEEEARGLDYDTAVAGEPLMINTEGLTTGNVININWDVNWVLAPSTPPKPTKIRWL